MTSQYHDITICMVCAFIYLILIKKYAVYYLLSLCMNVMFQDFFFLKYIYTRIQLLRLFVKKLLNSQWFI